MERSLRWPATGRRSMREGSLRRPLALQQGRTLGTLLSGRPLAVAGRLPSSPD